MHAPLEDGDQEGSISVTTNPWVWKAKLHSNFFLMFNWMMDAMEFKCSWKRLKMVWILYLQAWTRVRVVSVSSTSSLQKEWCWIGRQCSSHGIVHGYTAYNITYTYPNCSLELQWTPKHLAWIHAPLVTTKCQLNHLVHSVHAVKQLLYVWKLLR